MSANDPRLIEFLKRVGWILWITSAIFYKFQKGENTRIFGNCQSSHPCWIIRYRPINPWISQEFETLRLNSRQL
jgi:hypothetical protein